MKAVTYINIEEAGYTLKWAKEVMKYKIFVQIGKLAVYWKMDDIFKSYMKLNQQCNTCKLLYFKNSFTYFFCLTYKSTKFKVLEHRRAIF